MNTVIAWLLAATSTMAFLMLWFWVVHRELREKRNMVESAELQLAACRKKQLQARDSEESETTKAVLDRSFDIYRQSLAIYQETLQKPWNHIPGRLMGFDPLNINK